MKDLGFNEFGELSRSGIPDDENSKIIKQTEMTKIGKEQVDSDPEGEEEAESTEIAI